MESLTPEDQLGECNCGVGYMQVRLPQWLSMDPRIGFVLNLSAVTIIPSTAKTLTIVDH